MFKRTLTTLTALLGSSCLGLSLPSVLDALISQDHTPVLDALISPDQEIVNDHTHTPKHRLPVFDFPPVGQPLNTPVKYPAYERVVKWILVRFGSTTRYAPPTATQPLGWRDCGDALRATDDIS